MSSSEQELTHTFHSSDLPLDSIPAPLDSNSLQSSQSDSSLIESGSDFVISEFHPLPQVSCLLHSLLLT